MEMSSEFYLEFRILIRCTLFIKEKTQINPFWYQLLNKKQVYVLVLFYELVNFILLFSGFYLCYGSQPNETC